MYTMSILKLVDESNTGVELLMLKLLAVTLLLKAPHSVGLQRFEFKPNGWQAVGSPIQVVIGKNGLVNAAHKVEGDNKTPTGLYKLGPDFGLSSSTLVISEKTVCVDDIHSKYYGKIVTPNYKAGKQTSVSRLSGEGQNQENSNGRPNILLKIDQANLNQLWMPAFAGKTIINDENDTISNRVQPDWHSAEQMHDQPLYRQGIAVQTNGVGSCIFMHIWRGPKRGTAGCIAMSEADMIMLKAWLKGENNPMILIGAI